MATALAATFQAGNSTRPARVLLQVSGAPTTTPAYTSNFATTVNGWTAGSGGAVSLYGGGPVPAVRMLSAADTTTYFSRTVTGLTVGQVYRFSLMALMTSGRIALGVSGMGYSSFKQPVRPPGRTAYTFTFTATATSHVIQVALQPLLGVGADYADYYVDTVKVEQAGTWLGTTIYRSDANGSLIPVRESQGGQDTTGSSGSGTMTVYDYEAALAGPVQYTVVDGNGATAVAALSSQTDPGVWVTLPASTTNLASSTTPPRWVPADLVTDYSESSVSNGSMHQIINRADPIANPGPLALRSGSVSIWCADYAAAAALRDLLSGGDVGLLRQPTFVGLDLYFVAKDVRLAMDPNVTPTRRWIAQVEYQEVLSP